MNIKSFIKEHKWYYTNPALTTANFPEQKVEAGEPQQLILDKWTKGPEVMALLKEKKLRPANVYEFMAWFEKNKDTIKGAGKWYVAFGSQWPGSDGDHRVPFVHALSAGDFYFDLGRFEDVWDDDDVLLVFSDKTSGTETLGETESSGSLTLESAIEMVKEAGYVIYKPV